MRIKIPYLTSSIEEDIIMTLYLAPLWWVLGFSIFIYQMVAVWAFMKLLIVNINNATRIEIPKLAAFPALLSVSYAFSLIINLPQNQMQRIQASLYNYSFWIMGLLLIIAIYNSFNADSFRRLLPAINFNIAVAGILAVISVLLWTAGFKQIEYRTPLLMFLPSLGDIPLLKYSATINLIGFDWFADTTLPRLKVLSPYPTALAAVLIMMLSLFIVKSDLKKSYKIAVAALGIFALLVTLSRTAIIGFLIAILTVYLLNRRHRMAFVMAAFVCVLLVWPVLTMVYGMFSDLRKGSSELRLSMYRYTIEYVLATSPFIGVGIKPREDFFAIPVGSHSMYLSIFIKTGIIGLFSFIAMQVHIFKKWFDGTTSNFTEDMKALWNAIGVSLIAMSLWLATEDLDAPQMVAYLYFLLIGIMSVLQRKMLFDHAKET